MIYFTHPKGKYIFCMYLLRITKTERCPVAYEGAIEDQKKQKSFIH